MGSNNNEYTSGKRTPLIHDGQQETQVVALNDIQIAIQELPENSGGGSGSSPNSKLVSVTGIAEAQ